MPVSPPPSRRYRIADRIVEPSTNRVVGPAGTRQLEPKVMDVLEYLLAHPGITISTSVLHDAVWPDTIVEDSAIRRAISQLRKAFGDDARHPRIIETIPRKGYRLVADIVAEAAPRPDLAAPPTPARAPGHVALLGLGLVGGVVALLLGLRATGGEAPMPPRRTVVTAEPGIERSPALSPDGSRLAYLHYDGTAQSAYVRDLDGSPPRRLAQHAVGFAWSPDGTRLAVLRRDAEACTLVETPVRGGTATVLRSDLTCALGPLAWSSTDRRLALSATVISEAKPEAPRTIALYDRATGTLTPFSTPGDATDTHPVFAPDGRSLAFLRRSPDGWLSLVVQPLSGGGERVIVREGARIVDFTWRPDGRALLFSSNRGGNYRLWSVPAEGGTPTWLAQLGAYDPSSPTLNRTGDRLAYAEWDFDFNLWSVPLTSDTAQAVPAVRSSRWDLHPRFSPDGERLAFTSNQGSSHELWIARADGSDPKPVTSVGTGFVGHPRWSPDGRHIAVEVRREAAGSIHLLDVEHGTLRALTDDAAHDTAPGWSADGRWVYFGSYRSGSWQLWKSPVDGGPVERVTDDGGFTGTESADGQWLYYVRPHRDGLWRRRTQGGPAERLPIDLAWADWGSWEQQGDGLYFIARLDDGRPTFNRLDLTTGQLQRLGQARNPIAQHKPSLTVHPDGTRLIYTQTDRAESEVVLLEAAAGTSLW